MSLERNLTFNGSGIHPFDGSADPQKINILLVDDSADCLMALKEVLDGPDRHLVMVQSGEEALRYLLGAEVGVVLLDIRLSGLNGYETAALIRQRSRTKSVPIIFLTGYSKEDEDVARGYSFGAVDYIFKPVDPSALKSKADCFVELAKSNQTLKRQTLALTPSEKEFLRSRTVALLLKHAPVPTFVAGLDGLILQANLLVGKILGLQVDQAIGAASSGTLTPGERWLLIGAVREAAERGVKREVVVHPRPMSGQPMAFALHIAPLRNDEDRVIGVIGMGQDMRRYEQAMLDLERTRVELEGRVQEVAHLKEIVVARDLSLLRLQKEHEALRLDRRRVPSGAPASDSCREADR